MSETPASTIPDTIVQFEMALDESRALLKLIPEFPRFAKDEFGKHVSEIQSVSERLMRFGHEIYASIVIDPQFGERIRIRDEALRNFQVGLSANYYLATNPHHTRFDRQTDLDTIAVIYSQLKPYAAMRLGNPTLLQELALRISQEKTNPDEAFRLSARGALRVLGTTLIFAGIGFVVVILGLGRPLELTWVPIIVACILVGGILLMASAYPERVSASLKAQIP